MSDTPAKHPFFASKAKKSKTPPSYPCGCKKKCKGHKVTPEEVTEMVCVSAEPLGYGDVIVETHNDDVVFGVERMTANKELAKACFVGAWKATRDLNIPELYAEQGEKWKTFCDDVVLFAVARFVLFGKHIPLVAQKA